LGLESRVGVVHVPPREVHEVALIRVDGHTYSAQDVSGPFKGLFQKEDVSFKVVRDRQETEVVHIGSRSYR